MSTELHHRYDSFIIKLPARLHLNLLIWRLPFILLNQGTDAHTLFHIQPPAAER